MAVRYWLGSVLMVLGLGLLADQLYPGLEFGIWLARLWPLAVILLGVILLVTRSATWIGGIIILIIGCLLQIAALGFVTPGAWGLIWPAFLILLGVAIVFRLGRPGVAGGSTEDVVNHFVIFSGLETRPQTANFRGGSVTAAFGGADLDLRNALLSKDGAYLEVTAAFGAVDVIVPKEWKIDVNGIPLFGGWSNETSPVPTAGSPVLTIRCLAVFGGIGIKNNK
jgi:hypothetical protein